ncbi:MAG: peptidylprolyl isomerase [Desulforegulaceae bacterium]|jgi:cyclophilin family peptidyl-prolyl cis-trans isomerase|nr:peptidylprolyl isomerase [Desulforegulaceae bacterium]
MKSLVLFVLFVAGISLFSAQNAEAQKNVKVILDTDMGEIEIVLYEKTKEHRENFVKLVKEGFYDGLLFHRIIENFMIQGGDPESKNASKDKMLGSGGPGYTIPAEIMPEYYHKKGAISAARTGDNMNPMRRSSGSQFFIVTGKVYSSEELSMYEKRLNTKFSDEQKQVYTTIGGTPFLDAQYSVFGEVVKGMDVVEKLEKVKTASGDRPLEDVKIKSAKIVE